MTTQFVLAAQVLLTRRLKNFVRVDEDIEIDMSYVTCAEYQLFADAQHAEGKNVQPDHWIADRFSSGTAKHPVLGVRANDAKDFCKWLTYKKLTPGLQYRLPTASEIRDYPITNTSIGCWALEGERAFVAIGSQQYNVWRDKLHEQLKTYDITKVNNISILFLDLLVAHNLDRSLDAAIQQLFDQALEQSFCQSLDQILEQVIDQALGFYRAQELLHEHDLMLTLLQTLNHNCNQNLIAAYSRNHNFDIDYQKIQNYLLHFIIFWTLLANVCNEALQTGNNIQRIDASQNKYLEISHESYNFGTLISYLYCFFY